MTNPARASRFAPLFVAMLAPVLALSGGCGRRHHDLDPAKVDRAITEHINDYLDDVKATDAQRTRIRAIKDRLEPEGLALAASQREAGKEIATQLASNTPDRARLHALVDRQLDAARAFAHKSVDGAVEAHDTLSPEQRAPLAKKLQRFASR